RSRRVEAIGRSIFDAVKHAGLELHAKLPDRTRGAVDAERAQRVSLIGIELEVTRDFRLRQPAEIVLMHAVPARHVINGRRLRIEYPRIPARGVRTAGDCAASILVHIEREQIRARTDWRVA